MLAQQICLQLPGQTMLLLRFLLAIWVLVVCESRRYVRHPCAIPRIWSPVCGTDGKTYSNKWAVNCRNFEKTHLKPVKIAYEGECGRPFYLFDYPKAMHRYYDYYDNYC